MLRCFAAQLVKATPFRELIRLMNLENSPAHSDLEWTLPFMMDFSCVKYCFYIGPKSDLLHPILEELHESKLGKHARYFLVGPTTILFGR